MNIADLVLLVAWGFFAVRGYIRGLLRELGALVAIFAGLKLATQYHDQLSPHIRPFVSSDSYASPTAYVIILILTLLAFRILVGVLAGIMKVTFIKWLDNLLGGVFGAAKGVVLSAVALMAVTAFLPRPDFLVGSKLVPTVSMVGGFLVGVLPPQWQRNLSDLKKTVTDAPEAAKRAAQEAAKQMVKEAVKDKVQQKSDTPAPSPDAKAKAVAPAPAQPAAQAQPADAKPKPAQAAQPGQTPQAGQTSQGKKP